MIQSDAERGFGSDEWMEFTMSWNIQMRAAAGGARARDGRRVHRAVDAGRRRDVAAARVVRAPRARAVRCARGAARV